MNRVGSRQNLIKELMGVLGKTVVPQRINEAMSILSDIQEYNFKPKTNVYFYYDEIIDDVMCLTENKNEVDWEAELVVEIQYANDEKGFYAQVSFQ